MTSRAAGSSSQPPIATTPHLVAGEAREPPDRTCFGVCRISNRGAQNHSSVGRWTAMSVIERDELAPGSRDSSLPRALGARRALGSAASRVRHSDADGDGGQRQDDRGALHAAGRRVDGIAAAAAL